MAPAFIDEIISRKINANDECAKNIKSTVQVKLFCYKYNYFLSKVIRYTANYLKKLLKYCNEVKVSPTLI